MAPKQTFTWEEYRGIAANLTINLLIIPYLLLALICFPVLRAVWLSDPPANWNPNHAWHIVGNESMWQPEIQNFTDTNENSSTFGLWVPPPGTRSAPFLVGAHATARAE